MSRWLKCTSMHFNTDWNKYDDRLMKAVERGEVDKVATVLGKKGIIPTKLDVEGRSAFHLAATQGQLECLNLMLGHNVDVTAKDASGKSALHMASKYGNSLCVQKLLQHNCPVGNMDLQGRTALHDAVMAGCTSSVKLLCDNGASVNISDFDGRTPLILATQMCHPHLCQLLLERGADFNVRDKQNKTPLILGCEFGCKDAVEVLLKTGTDVKAVDNMGHDAFHYARLSNKPELTAMIKSHLEKANRENEAAKIEQWKRQVTQWDLVYSRIIDLERQNEALQEVLRKYHLEQKLMTDKVNMLQHQLMQKEQLKALFSGKDKEEGGRSPETVRVQLRSALVSDFIQTAGGWDHPEVESLRRELDTLQRKLQTAEEEKSPLQTALNQKSRECQELAQSRDAIQKRADQQVQELEDALGDVQKRMLDSECKVKQLQAHVVAVKGHLGGQATEELRAQLQDMKAKYEGASAEVGRVRNRLKQSEKALEEYKSSESQLAAEMEQLNQELAAQAAERDELTKTLLTMENLLNNTVAAEKFDNMKNLLTNAVDEKERQLAELREDYDRVLEEMAELHRKLDAPSSAEEHQRIVSALEEQNATLKQKLMDVTSKSQILIKEVEESRKERDLLRKQLNQLNSRMENEFIAIKDHEAVRKDMALEELKDKLVEAGERYGKAEGQLQQVQAEKAALQETMQGGSKMYQRELNALKAHNGELIKKLQLVQKRCEDGEKEREELTEQKQALKRSVEEQFVSREQLEKVKMELNSTLESVKADKLKLEAKLKESTEELKNVKEGNEKLKAQLEKVTSEMKRECISMKEHRGVTDKLNAAVIEAKNRANQASAQHALAQEEVAKLSQELEAQKTELDTIQEAIQSKFIPLTAAEEKETTYSSWVKELEQKLAETEEKYHREKSVWESMKQEKLKLETEFVQQRLDSALVSTKKHKQVEEEFKAKLEALAQKSASLEEQLQEATLQKTELQDQNALCNTQIQNLQEQLKSKLTRIATYDTEQTALHDAAQQAQVDCKKAREAQQEEAQRVAVLQKELQEQRREQTSLLQRHEAEVAKLQVALREEEESNAQRAEDVRTLQSELLRATQALEDVRHKDEQVNELKKVKLQLEDDVVGLGDKLLSLTQEFQKAHLEERQAREGESRARAEMAAVEMASRGVEREIGELRERYDDSLSTISNLQKRIQASAQQTEAKDKKITELLTDVERLKQALNGLSQLTYTSNTPNKRQTQQVDTLQAQIMSLQQQLADAERKHREVVSIYRIHLLRAAQGHMDEDVQAVLLQILRMREEFVC
uniref:Uveal autoantigen with coiled-coil domains and ankyrin repeats b n=1 Tax=Xiphophorus couchianus TaxID=32473 RepID=A0A3B5MJK8_9TELE